MTTGLITFLAAGLAAQAANFLQQAGVATMMSDTAWDTSAVLSDTSLFGRVLHTLIGYSDQPSVLQVVVYARHTGGDIRADQGLRAAHDRAPAADAADAKRLKVCAAAVGAAGFAAATRRNSDGPSRSPVRRRLRPLLPGGVAGGARARRRSGANPARRRADQPIKQIALTEAQVQSYIAAAADIEPILDKAPQSDSDQLDPQTPPSSTPPPRSISSPRSQITRMSPPTSAW